MEITYKWLINIMECKAQEGDLVDVVVKVAWSRMAITTKDGKDYQCSIPGIQVFNNIDPSNFTPYNELTYDQVCGWLDATINTTPIDISLARTLDEIVNPPLIELPLPWVSPTPTSTPTNTPTPSSTPSETPTPTETLPEPTPTITQ